MVAALGCSSDLNIPTDPAEEVPAGDVAASASRSTVTADPSTIVAGSGIATITVTVRDEDGNPIDGAIVSLQGSGTDVALRQPTGVTGANGIVTGTLQSGVPGTKVVSATVNGSVPVTQTAQVNVLVVSASRLELVAGDDQTAQAGTAVPVQPAVRVVNSQGQPVPGYGVSFAVTSGGGSVTPAIQTTDAAGIARVAWALGPTVGINTLAALTAEERATIEDFYQPYLMQVGFIERTPRGRKATAKAMMNALQTTAQLTAAVEVDVTSIMNLRAAHKDAFRAREGVSLSPLPLISRAVCMVLPRHPALNSSIDTEAGTATFHNYINLGMAVDTEAGLLVPNVKDAQDLTVPGLARRIADLASRARSKKLTPDDISGATFTITNTGSRGTLFDTPIFTPPQVAILATCAIEKRPVVVSDAYGDSIAIRWMSYLCLSYDHQMVDGADTARFLQDLKYVIETHDFASELGV
jgi:hypothetical protein